MAEKGDFSHFHFLAENLVRPFEENESIQSLKLPPKREEVVYKTFCGT
jgi:hypothetical protein